MREFISFKENVEILDFMEAASQQDEYLETKAAQGKK